MIDPYSELSVALSRKPMEVFDFLLRVPRSPCFSSNHGANIEIIPLQLHGTTKQTFQFKREKVSCQ
jgi:hypothetical protein